MLPAPSPSPSYSSAPSPSPIQTGLAMLLVGIVIGYLIHPSISSLFAPASPQLSEATPTVAPTPDTARASQAAAIMEAVLARTRHFKGSPTAPITLIEFGDYQ